MGRPQYVIEHMEEDDPDAPSKFPHWALLEYRHMLTLTEDPSGPTKVHFTSLSKASIDDLRRELGDAPNYELHTESIETLMKQWGVPLERICLLDPKATRKLDVCDAGRHPAPANDSGRDGPFDYFLFGGILGDDPPRDRTGSLRVMGFPGRSLGKTQMTTDSALGVTKRCIEDGLHLHLPASEEDPKTQEESEGDRGTGRLEFIDQPELNFGGGESVRMPFRYMTEPGRRVPLMPPGMREHIRKDLDRAFEF